MSPIEENIAKWREILEIIFDVIITKSTYNFGFR